MDIKLIDSVKLIESLQEGIVVHEKNTTILYANPTALKLLRLTEGQALGRDSMDPNWHFIDKNHRLIPHEDYPVNRVLRDKKSFSNFEVGICDSSSDEVTWVLCGAYPQLDNQGEIDKIIISLSDITESKTEIPFDLIVANANDIIVITKAKENKLGELEIVYVNKAFTRLTGYSFDEIIGQSPKILQGEGTSLVTRSKIKVAIKNRVAIRETILNYSKSGAPYWLDMNIFPLEDEQGNVSYFAAVERDSTLQVENESKLISLSRKDPLTNLMNRRGFYLQVQKQVESSQDAGGGVFAIVDIDFFKKINDTHGHESGDKALVELSNIFRETFRKDDLICRFGGEEFVVLLPNINLANGERKLEDFRKRVSLVSFKLSDLKSINLTISIGLAYFEYSTSTIEEVIKQADICLYKAKELGRNQTIVHV